VRPRLPGLRRLGALLPRHIGPGSGSASGARRRWRRRDRRRARNSSVRRSSWGARPPHGGPNTPTRCCASFRASGTDAEVILNTSLPRRKTTSKAVAGSTQRFDRPDIPGEPRRRGELAQGRPYTTKALEKCLSATMDAGCGKARRVLHDRAFRPNSESVRSTVRYCGGSWSATREASARGFTAFHLPLAPFIDPGSARPSRSRKSTATGECSTRSRSTAGPALADLEGRPELRDGVDVRDGIVEASYEAGAGAEPVEAPAREGGRQTAAKVERANSLARRVMEGLEAGRGGATPPGAGRKLGGGDLLEGRALLAPRGARLNYKRILCSS